MTLVQQRRVVQAALVVRRFVDIRRLHEAVSVGFRHVEVGYAAPARIMRGFAFDGWNRFELRLHAFAEGNVASTRLLPVDAFHACCAVRLAFRREHVIDELDQGDLRFFACFVRDNEFRARRYAARVMRRVMTRAVLGAAVPDCNLWNICCLCRC